MSNHLYIDAIDWAIRTGCVDQALSIIDRLGETIPELAVAPATCQMIFTDDEIFGEPTEQAIATALAELAPLSTLKSYVVIASEADHHSTWRYLVKNNKLVRQSTVAIWVDDPYVAMVAAGIEKSTPYDVASY